MEKLISVQKREKLNDVYAVDENLREYLMDYLNQS